MTYLTWLARGALLVLVAGCTIRASSTPLDAVPDTESDATLKPPGGDTTITGTDGEPLDVPDPSPDMGTKPADRPSGAGTGKVRTCDAPLTEGKALRRSRIYTKTHPVKLGSAVIDGKATPATIWVSGTTQSPTTTNVATGGDVGPDLDDVGSLLGWDDDAAFDLYATHVNGKNPVQVWAEAMTPTARRLTYTFATSSSQQPYLLSGEKRASAAPNGTDEQFVRSLAAARSIGVSFVVTMGSDCALGALADLLGRKPIVKEGSGSEDGTLFDPSKRTEIQNLLVRDGAQIMLATITSREDKGIHEIVGDTTCSPTDLGACETVLDQLLDAAGAFMKVKGAPTYETLSSGTDPTWSFTTFTTGRVAEIR